MPPPDEGDAETAEEELEAVAETERKAAEEPPDKRAKTAAGTEGEIVDAGKIKLVKDVFGAEMIEEIKLNE